MLEMPYFWLFIGLLPVVAFLYASIGHGGASGYLALMALFSFSPETMRPTALLLNLFVSAAAFYYYHKAGHFNRKLFLYFGISSVPMAFLGGLIAIDTTVYKYILGVFLLFAFLKMLNVFQRGENQEIKEIKYWQGLLVGGSIGFLSGLIGIGGGIILSPMIILLHWGRIKEAAAVSALFIWVNSAAGFIGQLSSGIVLGKNSWLMVVVAVLGGLVGGFVGSQRLHCHQLQYLLAFVLMMASVKLFIV